MILQIEIAGHLRHVQIERIEGGNRFLFAIDGRALEIDAAQVEAGTWSLLLPDGSQHLVAVTGTRASGFTVHLPSGKLSVGLPESRRQGRRPRSGLGAGGDGPARLVAPMPGKVVRVLVAPGQRVQTGQAVMVVEAMKMENELRAPREGIVKEILAREGISVEAGAVLAVVE